jgi:hypothetical protein
MEEKLLSQQLQDKLNGELKLWDELVQEFRQWNREWKKFDAGIINTMPIDSIGLMEKLDKIYNISKK